MSIKQGTPGLAFASGDIQITNIASTTDLSILNFNREQATILTGKHASGQPGLQFILSYPVFSFDKEYRNLTTKVIGIINISSNNANELNLIADKEKRDSLIKNIVFLAEVCGYVM